MGLEELREEFKDDYGIVATKFYLQAANINFITGNFEEARKNALKGLEVVESLDHSKIPEEDIRRSMHNTKRDLLNVKIRTTAKLDSIDPWNLRAEEAEKNNLSISLMPIEDPERDAGSGRNSKSFASVGEQLEALGYGGDSGVATGAGEENEGEETFEMGTAALIFGSVSAIAAGVTYMMLQKPN